MLCQIRIASPKSAEPSRSVDCHISHAYCLVQWECSRRIVYLDFQVYVRRTATLKFTEHLPEQGFGDSLPPHEWMNDQILNEGTGPALRNSNDVLPLIDCKKTEISSELVVIPKAGPPVFEWRDVAAPLSVSDFKQAVDGRGIVNDERPQRKAGWKGHRRNHTTEVPSQPPNPVIHAI
jgi:hypothetical protein